MPEFEMDASGTVAVTWHDLDAFTQGFIEAAFFTESSPCYDAADWDSEEAQAALEAGTADGSIPGDAAFGDITPESLGAILRFCRVFQQINAELLAEAYARDYDERQAGRDLWYTHNGHGVGYWDRRELESRSIGDRLSQAAGRGEICVDWDSDGAGGGRVIMEGFPA